MMNFTVNGVSQASRKIASFGVHYEDKSEFKDNFSRLENLVLDNGTTTEEMKKFGHFQNRDGTIKSKDYKGEEVKMVRRNLEFINGFFMIVNDKNDISRVLKNFNKKSYKLIAASDEFSMYNIAVQTQYRDKVYTEIKKLGIQDDQINWLEDLPNDDSKNSTIMKYSVGTIKKSDDKKKKNNEPSGKAINGR